MSTKLRRMAEEAARKTVNSKPLLPLKRESPSANGALLPNKRPAIEPCGESDITSKVERVQKYIAKRSLYVGQVLDLSNRTGFLNRNTRRTPIEFAGNNIDLILTDSGRDAEEWVRQQTPKGCIVGLDLEWRPNFARGVENKTALLQLCTEKGCLILQMLYVDFVPGGLVRFLKDPTIKLVGVGVGTDVAKLRRDHGLDCKGEIVELGPLAAKRLDHEGLKQAGLKGLALAVLGLELSKPKKISTSNWASRYLQQKQIEYACIDAFVSFAIGKKLFDPEPFKGSIATEVREFAVGKVLDPKP